MVGYDNKKESPISDSAIAGGISGATTRLILQPFDVIKTRFQLQVEPISHSHETSKYRGMVHAVKIIWSEESLFAFWKGHVPAQILSIMYGITQFTVFELLTKMVANGDTASTRRMGPFTNFCYGSIATSLATFVSFPFDMMRTRFIAQGEFKAYNTIYEAASKIVKKEGFFALYKGLTPTVVQSVPYGGCQFGFYAVFTKLNTKLSWGTESENEKKSLGGNLVAGFLAGMCSKTIVYPFDLCRKRLQIQGFGHVRKNFGKSFLCSGMIDCFVKIYNEESFAGFFKGLQPSLIKSALATSLYFAIYERMMKILKTETSLFSK